MKKNDNFLKFSFPQTLFHGLCRVRLHICGVDDGTDPIRSDFRALTTF